MNLLVVLTANLSFLSGFRVRVYCPTKSVNRDAFFQQPASTFEPSGQREQHPETFSILVGDRIELNLFPVRIKQIRESFLCSFALVAVMSTLCCQPAHAYLDSGTGAFIVQMLLGGAMGFLVVLTRFRHQMASLFRRLTGKTAEETKETENE